jgi:hypothetical protein
VRHLLDHPQWWDEDSASLQSHMHQHVAICAQKMREQYSNKLLPSWLMDGQHRDEALLMVHKIRDKIEQQAHEYEIRQKALHDQDADQVYELIKIQQQSKNMHPAPHDDPLM